MPSLESHINSLNFSTQLEVVKNLLDSNAAHATTTFWGSRVVEVNGYTGSVYVDDIAKKILLASRERCDADDLTLAERISGVEIVNKLQQFYHDTDTEIQNASPITKFFNWIREFSINPCEYTVRPHIMDTDNCLIETAGRNFRAYSRAKFLQQFGTFEHPAFEGFMILLTQVTGKTTKGAYGRVIRNEDQRLYAKEENIRQLLARV